MSTKADKFTPIEFDVNNFKVRSAREEWQPHAAHVKSLEWWYITVLAQDIEGNNYFIFISASHYSGSGWKEKGMKLEIPPGSRATNLVGALHDYRRNNRIPLEAWDVAEDSSQFDLKDNALTTKIADYDIYWAYKEDSMHWKMNSPKVRLDLQLTNTNDVYWHKDKLGFDGLIQQGADDDRSYYYSIMNAPISGKLSIMDKDGKWRDLIVTGQSWVDRQWGDFFTLWWEWASFRFANGARVHIYNFYNGHQEAVYRTADGKVHLIKNCVVKQNGYVKDPVLNEWISFGWSFEFPFEIEGSKHYTVEPFTKNDITDIVDLKWALYEGPGHLINDETGERVGLSVNESAIIRYMENGPYQKNQH